MSLIEDLKKLERQQTDETVKAPSDGMILDLHSLYPGSVISQGTSVVTCSTGVELLTVFDVDLDISKLIRYICKNSIKCFASTKTRRIKR